MRLSHQFFHKLSPGGNAPVDMHDEEVNLEEKRM